MTITNYITNAATNKRHYKYILQQIWHGQATVIIWPSALISKTLKLFILEFKYWPFSEQIVPSSLISPFLFLPPQPSLYPALPSRPSETPGGHMGYHWRVVRHLTRGMNSCLHDLTKQSQKLNKNQTQSWSKTHVSIYLWNENVIDQNIKTVETVGNLTANTQLISYFI